MLKLLLGFVFCVDPLPNLGLSILEVVCEFDELFGKPPPIPMVEVTSCLY